MRTALLLAPTLALAAAPADDGSTPRVIESFAIDQPAIIGFNDWPFGGISGIEYVRGGEFTSLPSPPPGFVIEQQPGEQAGPVELFVVSDDRAELAPARIGTLTMELFADGHGRIGPLTWHALTDEFGSRFAEDRVDPEGVRVVPETGLVYWSSEGRTKDGEPPAVFEREPTGVTARLPLPAGFVADATDKGEQTVGVRNNRGFEALAYATFRLPDGRTARRVFAGVEEPLTQDESDAHDLCRVIVYEPDTDEIDLDRRASMTPARVLLYPKGPVPPGWEGEQNGLTEIVSVGPDRLLALERAERVVDGVPHYNARLYWVSTEGAADVSDRDGFADTDAADLPPMMMKRPLLDFADLADDLPGGRPMNLEGMALLPDGTLLIVSDNDHGEEGPTVFVRLRLPDDLDK